MRDRSCLVASCRLLVLTIVVGGGNDVLAQPATLPEGTGLASRYPGDANIDDDPHVLLAENFEIASLDDLSGRWSSISNEGGKVLSLDDDTPPASTGDRSIRMIARPPQNTGGHLYTRLPRGVDRVFARFYVKFPEDAGYVHHFVHLGGYNPPTPYPQGVPGPARGTRAHDRRHRADRPGRPRPAAGRLELLRLLARDEDLRRRSLLGEQHQAGRPTSRPEGRWQCVEVMMQCNSAPDRRDGELALWLDGTLVMHVAPGTPRERWTGLGFLLPEQGGEPFEGFRWRTTDDLKINFFWLLHYVTDTNNRRNDVDAARESPVLFDDIVVATEYIGPIVTKP